MDFSCAAAWEINVDVLLHAHARSRDFGPDSLAFCTVPTRVKPELIQVLALANTTIKTCTTNLFVTLK